MDNSGVYCGSRNRATATTTASNIMNKEVSVQLPTSAVNVTLPALAAARCAAIPCCDAGRTAIDRYLLPAGSTAANPPHAAEWANGTDRQTDGHRTVT